MSGGIQTFAMMVLLVGTLVLLHEGGHFLVARLFGVSVKVFSIGVGKRLFGFKIGGTDYRVSLLPIGGYVRWVGADPFADSGQDEDEWIDAKGSFIHKPAWQRLLIVAAGPVTNLILPLFVFTALFVAGEPQPRAEVGRVEHDTTAEKAGVEVGDSIVKVGDTETLTWVDVYEALYTFDGAVLPIVVRRNGVDLPLTLQADAGAELGTFASTLGLGDSAADTTVIIDDPASPAWRAGMAQGDVILKIDGVDVRTWGDVARELDGKTSAAVEARNVAGATFTANIQPDPAWTPTRYPSDDDTWAKWGLASATVSIGHIRGLPDGRASAAQCFGLKEGDRLLRVGERDIYTFLDVLKAVGTTVDGKPTTEGKARPIEFHVRRAGEVLTLSMQPDVVQDTDSYGRYTYVPRIGFGPGGDFLPPLDVPRPYGLLTAAKRAGQETWYIGTFMVQQIGLIITGDAPVSKNLGGPIEIFNTARKAAEQGVFVAARVFAQLSLSLGVINLLPIPVLDGGQIVTYAAEWLRGRPLPWRVRERLQQVGLLFLVSLLLVVSVWDIQKIVGRDDDAPVEAAAPPKCA